MRLRNTVAIDSDFLYFEASLVTDTVSIQAMSTVPLWSAVEEVR